MSVPTKTVISIRVVVPEGQTPAAARKAVEALLSAAGYVTPDEDAPRDRTPPHLRSSP